jgi:hypothetical protein
MNTIIPMLQEILVCIVWSKDRKLECLATKASSKRKAHKTFKKGIDPLSCDSYVGTPKRWLAGSLSGVVFPVFQPCTVSRSL